MSSYLFFVIIYKVLLILTFVPGWKMLLEQALDILSTKGRWYWVSMNVEVDKVFLADSTCFGLVWPCVHIVLYLFPTSQNGVGL